MVQTNPCRDRPDQRTEGPVLRTSGKVGTDVVGVTVEDGGTQGVRPLSREVGVIVKEEPVLVVANGILHVSGSSDFLVSKGVFSMFRVRVPERSETPLS